MKKWYSYKSKDRKVKGYCPADSEDGVASLAGYPVEQLVIERVRWNGKEFVKQSRAKQSRAKQSRVK